MKIFYYFKKKIIIHRYSRSLVVVGKSLDYPHYFDERSRRDKARDLFLHVKNNSTLFQILFTILYELFHSA